MPSLARSRVRDRQLAKGSAALTGFSRRSSGVADAVSVHSRDGESIVTVKDAGPIQSIVICAKSVRSQAVP